MELDWLAPVLVAIVAAVPGLFALRHQRKEVESSASGRLTESALSIVDEYQQVADKARARADELEERLDRLRASTDQRFKELQTEIDLQETAIENLNARNLKMQLILTIYVHQMRQSGMEPLIDPDAFDAITIEQLRLMADRLSHIEQRRAERRRENKV